MLTKFNNQTLNSNELVLLEMIKEAIGWRCVAQTVYPLSRQIKNKGLQSQSGEFSESVDLTEIKFGMSHYAQFAQVYENQIIKYLEKNKNLFPDFTSDNNDDSLIKPITTKNKINNIIII
jgi:Fic family protein